MPVDSEELARLRADVGRAVQAFNQYQQESYGRSGVFTLAWAISCEVTDMEMEKNDQALQTVIVPDGQLMTTSVGLFQIGQEHWRAR